MDVPSHRNDEARAAAVFEMPTGSPTEDEEKAPDFRELRLRATEALARIRAHGYSYDRSCLESYEAREMEIYKTESTGSKRDRRLFDAYVQTVLRPVYTALSEDAKTLVKDEAAELFRYTKPNSKHKRKISIITFPGSGWDEEVSPVESLSKGHRFSRSRTDSSYITRTSNSRVTTFGSDVTVATNFTLPEDSELPSTPFIRQPREWPKTEADADSDTGPEKLPESLQEAAEELNPPKTPQQDIPLGFTSGPIDWGDDPTLFGPPEEHPPVVEEPKNLGATLEGPESLLADYEEIAFLEQSRLHTLEASSEEEIELPLYRTRMDFTGANSGEITLTTGNLVAVSAMCHPSAENGTAWWLVQLMRSQRAGTGNYGWVPSEILTIAVEYSVTDYVSLHRRDSQEAPEVRVASRPGSPGLLLGPERQPMLEQYDDHQYTAEPAPKLGKPRSRGFFDVFHLSWSFKTSYKQQVEFSRYPEAFELPTLEYTFRPFASHPPKKHAVQPALLISPLQSQTTKLLFGERLCNPQYHELSYSYLAQLNESASKAIRDSRMVLSQIDRLVKLLHLVALRMDSTTSIKGFTNTWRGMLVSRGVPGDNHGIVEDIINLAENSENGSSSGSEDIPENMATANNIRFADADTEKRAYEPLTFVIESWLMVDLTGFCGLFDHHDHPLLSAPIEVALDPMLPPLIDPATLEHTTKQLLVPAEMSATMLHDWKCLHFTWTPNTAEHLSYTQSTGQVKLYGHVSYCFLHALAGSDSSLLKRGFTRHHAALLEIAHTYRLLFGADPESRVLFSELDVKNRLAGYFDIFDELPPADTQPRLHYLLAKDFPIYGERLLALRLLLKPTGLRSLWKDKRDSLQWYTFWAVVFLGVLGIGVGVVQVALGAVQAYASMAALRQSQHGRRSYPPLV